MTEDSSDAARAEFLDGLRAMVGQTGSAQVARDPVNLPTVRNWCDAMSEANPYFTDPEAAASGPHGGLVAPPAMLNVWTMAGLTMGSKPRRSGDEPSSGVYRKLDAAGFSSVVATNSEHVYDRYLRPGDLLSSTTTLTDVSAEKTTALGVGHFVTTEATYTDQNGERVGSMLFRVLKFKPGTGKQAEGAGGDPDEPRPPRPRPQWNQDQAWFWDGLRQRELRIQRFTDDGSLVHPPANANPRSQAMDYDWVVASGKAKLYSYTVPHYPEVPAFDYPLIVGLVELEEGVRVVSNIVGVEPAQLRIGMPLEVTFLDTHDDVTIHQFTPARTGRRAETLTLGQVAVGDELPLCPIPLDPRLIISTAIATRDFQDVHHDRDLAQAKGSRDIFMNILTSSGLCNRWIGDWAGSDAVFKSLRISLGAPNYPYDTMTMSGKVAAVAEDGTVTVGFRGMNALGPHVTGTAELLLPGEGR